MSELPCLDDGQLQRLIEGQLLGPEHHAANRHLSECDACLQIVGELMRSTVGGEEADPAADAWLREQVSSGEGEVGGYQLRGVIGAGAMGVVYEAYDPKLARKVALKFVRIAASEPARVAVAQSRLLREAQAMARLSHPGVVKVYELGTSGTSVFIAMELVVGGTLTQWIAEKAHPVGDVLAMFVRVGEGLGAAHEAGIVHRDFKPDNVLLGDDGRVRVTDFGLAQAPAAASATQAADPWHPLSHEAPSEHTLYHPGALLGTPRYMSPEQLAGAPADVRSDVFAFCAALYEALCGQRPFEGDTLAALSANVSAGRLRPSPRARALPRWLEKVVARGLTVDPERRYQSMRPLLHALTRKSGLRRLLGRE